MKVSLNYRRVSIKLNQILEGPTWERLLLLINCPYLALSATVGNPESFHRWLHSSMVVRACLNNLMIKLMPLQYQELQKQRHIEATPQQLSGSADTRKKGSKQPTATPSNRSYEVALISHTERYADLSKSAYVPAGTLCIPHVVQCCTKVFLPRFRRGQVSPDSSVRCT